jgi:hypothetical protein
VTKIQSEVKEALKAVEQCREEQEQELEAIKSIFPTELTLLSSFPPVFSIQVRHLPLV